MSWVKDLASFAKKLLMLETRVEANTEEIKALRQDMQALTKFTYKVANVVRRNQEKTEHNQAMLIKSLENELLKLECRLNASGQASNLNGSTHLPHILPESKAQNE